LPAAQRAVSLSLQKRVHFRHLQTSEIKTVAGSSLSEPEFVQKIVFEGSLKLGADVKAKQMSGLPALKALRAGEVDAVVLDAQEFQSLPALPFASEFTTIFTSKRSRTRASWRWQNLGRRIH